MARHIHKQKTQYTAGKVGRHIYRPKAKNTKAGKTNKKTASLTDSHVGRWRQIYI
jgi:hypothetical protein